MLINLENRNPPRINYIGVSFSMTHYLFYFWRKNGFKLVFIQGKKNQSTGEYICIMLYPIEKKLHLIPNWIRNYQFDFFGKFLNMLSWRYNHMSSVFAYSIIQNTRACVFCSHVYQSKMKKFFSNSNIYKISFFIENSCFDFKILEELFPQITKAIIWNNFIDKKFLLSEILLLISVGLQHKTLADLKHELNYKTEDITFLSKQVFKKFMHIYFK
jgi:N-acetyltransferase 10